MKVHFRFVNNNKIYYITLLIVFLLITLPYTSRILSIKEYEHNQNNCLHMVIDCRNHKNVFSNYGEINCGPIPNPNVDGVDLTNQFKLTGFNFVRNHDFSGPTDISMIFPDMSKDPLNPANYNFAVSDHYISKIIEANCSVFYRLGESASTNASLRRPPENVSKWAEICKHIVMHYNDGWADGFSYNISYWEIWNEPDLTGFWNGTSEQYFELYKETAVSLKQYNPDLKIGGPCTSSISNKNFTTGFLTYVKEENIPLDFFSWHMYANTPFQLYNGSKYVRDLLDSFELYTVENINTEWNYNILSPQRDKDNAKNAAFTAYCLSAFQKAGIDKAFRYRATQDNNPLSRFIGFDLSLFTSKGEFKKPALSYLAINYLIDQTPIQLDTSPITENGQRNLIAGISDDSTNISLLLSNFDAKKWTISINFEESLPWNESCIVAVYSIDDEHDFQIIDQYEINPKSFIFNLTSAAPSVYFVRITNSSVLPPEGPVTAEIPFFLRLPFFDPLAKILGFLLLLLFF